MSQMTYLATMINIIVTMPKIFTGKERYYMYIKLVIYINSAKSLFVFLPNKWGCDNNLSNYIKNIKMFYPYKRFILIFF